MTETKIECAVCMVQFNSDNELRKHSFMFQSEIATSLARLQSLIAHHWPTQNRNREVVHAGDSDYGEEAPGSCDMTHRCPHEDCAKQAATFEREQELIRHYGIHYICNEYCLCCGNVYTRANKFWQHKCATKNPTDHVRRRKKVLRDMVKDQLVIAGQRKKRDRAISDANSAKRFKFSDATDASERTGTGPFEVQFAQGAGQDDGATKTTSETIDEAQNACVSAASNVPPAEESLAQAPLWPSGYCVPNFHVRSSPVFTPLWPEGMPANNSANLFGSIHSDTPSTLYAVSSQVAEMFSQPQEEFPIHTCL